MGEILDVIIFGASGFTGKYVVKEISRLTSANYKSFTWGIAGRSEYKLQQVLQQLEDEGTAVSQSIPIMIADAQDETSLRNMTAKAKLIINCCGPYHPYGEAVIKVCIEMGVHQIDFTAEIGYMKRMMQKYHKLAEEKGVYIVHACGVESIPADLGVVFLEKNFRGTLNSIESYVELDVEEGYSIPAASFGSLHSITEDIASERNLRTLISGDQLKNLPHIKPKLKLKVPFHYSSVTNSWAVIFPGPQRSVISWSQQYFYENEQKRPIQIQSYVANRSKLNLLRILIMEVFFMLCTRLNCTKRFLLKHPKGLSGGLVEEEPSLENHSKTRFSLTLHGKGWSEKFTGKEDEHEPNATIVGRIKGPNSGYGFTGTAAVLSALVLLSETENLPPKGGVFTPAVVFGRTSLVRLLQENGTRFEIISTTGDNDKMIDTKENI